MSNIKPLFGGPIPGEVDPDLVEELQGLLDDAKSGALLAIGYCTVRSSDEIGTGWVGCAGTNDKLSTAIMMMTHRYSAALLDRDA